MIIAGHHDGGDDGGGGGAAAGVDVDSDETDDCDGSGSATNKRFIHVLLLFRASFVKGQ